MSSPYREQISKMVWSFSRLNSYVTCPYDWKLHYIDHVSQVGSGFAEWGSLCHSIFEDYAKGNLAEFELLGAYEERYPQYMQNEFPPVRGKPLAEKYYERGRELFAAFSGYPENWEILAVEETVNFQVDGYHFTGFIDLLVRDRTDGKLIVVDHKSKAAFKTRAEQAHYAIQLYLYAYWVHEQYGEYPKELLFNMFRVDKVVHIPFVKEDMDNAIRWFLDTVHKIEEDEDFWDMIALEYERENKPLSEYSQTSFFCSFLCGSKRHCPRSKFYLEESLT